MFCPILSPCSNNAAATTAATMLEEIQNFSNWSRAVASDVPVNKRKQFLANKIHKLKKLLKFGSKSLAKKRTLEERQNNENEIEHRQNMANEILERKLAMQLQQQQQQQQQQKQKQQQHHYQYLEDEQNMVNENWENWDSCYLCAGQQQQQQQQQHHPLYPSYTPITAYSNVAHHPSSQHSICYVFMPGQPEPVPVKLRTAKIPGGVMWISYQPDLDIRAGDNLYAYTSSQIPQGQRAILV